MQLAQTSSDEPDGLVSGEKMISAPSALVLTLSSLSVVTVIPLSGGILVGISGNGSWFAGVIAMIITLCVAGAICAFARQYVMTGSVMSYVGTVFGPWATRLTASAYLIGYCLCLSAMVPSSTMYLGSVLVRQGQSWAASPFGGCIIMVCVTAGAAMLARRGLAVAAIVVSIILAVSMPVMLYVLYALVERNGVDLTPQLSLSGVSPAQIAAGVAAALCHYVGFDGSAAISARTRKPKTYVPLILLSSILIVGALTTILGCLIQIPTFQAHVPELERGISPINVLSEAAGLGFLGSLLDTLFACCAFAGLVSFFSLASTIFSSAASQGMVPARFAFIHPKYGTPSRAIAFLACLTGTLPAVLFLISQAKTLVIMGYLSSALAYLWSVPYVLVCAGAIRLRLRQRGFDLVGLTYAAGAASVIVVTAYNISQIGEGFGLAHVPVLAFLSIGIVYIYVSKSVVSSDSEINAQTDQQAIIA